MRSSPGVFKREPEVPAELRGGSKVYRGFSKADLAELCVDLLREVHGETLTGTAIVAELLERREVLRLARQRPGVRTSAPAAVPCGRCGTPWCPDDASEVAHGCPTCEGCTAAELVELRAEVARG